MSCVNILRAGSLSPVSRQRGFAAFEKPRITRSLIRAVGKELLLLLYDIRALHQTADHGAKLGALGSNQFEVGYLLRSAFCGPALCWPLSPNNAVNAQGVANR